MKAIVVGAGLAGTSAAYVLKNAGYEVKLIESTDHIGGRANTVAENGYLVDTAASAMSTSYTAYLALAEEAGVSDQVVPASPFVGLVRDDRVHELDMRNIQWSGLWTGLLSWRAKIGLLRLFRDVFSARRQGMLNYNDLGKAAPIDNESVASYALREFSGEIHDYFCDPVVRVMLLTNGDKVSKVEFFSGIANILDTRMCSMRGGQQRFPERLAQDIDVQYCCKASSVRDIGDHVEVRWSGPRGEEKATADVCVVACHLNAATAICPDYRSLLEPLNNKLRYTKAISVSVGASVPVPTQSFMLFVPKCEERDIATIFLEHNKCSDRAPSGHSLMTCYFEENASEVCWGLSDEKIIERTLDYVYRIFPVLRGKVDLTHVKRWDMALPLMQIGGYTEVAMLNSLLDPAAHIQFAGDYLSGAGQNTAVDFGVKAARNIISHRRRP